MKLREIAHGRTGDKGNTCNISVIAYDRRDYPHLQREVTAARVRQCLDGVVLGEIVRHELPQLGALNFVMTRANMKRSRTQCSHYLPSRASTRRR